MMTFGWPLMMFGGIFFVLFWVLIIGGAIWLILTLTRGSTGVVTPPAPGAQTPLDILKLRYAKGEITKEQYDQMRADLGA